jgi:hypothetical protein
MLIGYLIGALSDTTREKQTAQKPYVCRGVHMRASMVAWVKKPCHARGCPEGVKGCRLLLELSGFSGPRFIRLAWV